MKASSRLSGYLERIGFSGIVRPSLETMADLLRCHVLSVPFENLDVQLGVPVSIEPDSAFDKIVGRGRGGWCYEQNGLFGWALAEIGFDVTRVAAAVRRNERGESALANHLCLLVRTPDDPESVFLADVGFGGSMIAPIPLEAAQHEQVPFRLGLQRLADGHWRFIEESVSDTVSYDFLAEVGDESAMSAKCDWLQTDPGSSFVLTLVAQRRTPRAHVSLRGRVFKRVTSDEKETRLVQSADELVETLKDTFRLDVPEVADLWDRIVRRHVAVFGE